MFNIENIFSITTTYAKDKNGLITAKHRTIHFFGIKFNLKLKMSYHDICLNEQLEFLLRNINIANRNLILALELKPGEIAYLKNNSQSYFFTNEFLKLDKEFVLNYLENTRENTVLNQIEIIDKNSDFYKEHSEYAQNGEFCWKYVCKNNGVFKTSLFRQDGDVYFKYDFLGVENGIFNGNFTWAYPKPRKYTKGVCLYDILITLNEEEQFKVIKNFFDWLFEEYKLENSDLISGELADCHFKNFIVTEDGKFYYTDYEYKSETPLEKGYLIYFALSAFGTKLHNENNKMYKKLIDLYGLENKFKKYRKQKRGRLFAKIDDEERKRKEEVNKDLIEKYMNGYTTVNQKVVDDNLKNILLGENGK